MKSFKDLIERPEPNRIKTFSDIIDQTKDIEKHHKELVASLKFIKSGLAKTPLKATAVLKKNIGSLVVIGDKLSNAVRDMNSDIKELSDQLG